MLKTFRSSSLVLAATLILATALGATATAPAAQPVPAAQAPSPSLAQVLCAATQPEAPAFLTSGATLGRLSFQCIPLPVNCCQVGWNGHCRYCIHQDPSCGLP